MMKKLTWALGLAVAGMVCAQDLPLPEYPEFFPAESTMTKPAMREDTLQAERRQLLATVQRKLKIADTLYRLKRYQPCADLCEEIILLDPSCREASEMREKAKAALVKDGLRNAEAEMRTGANRQLLSNLEDSITPQKGPVRERPQFDPDTLPFAAQEAEMANARAQLDQKICKLARFDNAKLSDVLQFLSDSTGVNIIYKPETVTDKTVTINARNLHFTSILDFLARTCDIGYKVEKEMVWIYAKSEDEADEAAMRANLTTAVIPLKYGLSPYPGGSTGGNDDDGGGLFSNSEKSDPGRLSAKNITGDPSQEANPTDLGTMLTWMETSWPGWPKESKWFIDRKLNRLVIASTPDIIEEVRKIVQMLDVPPVQILITAQFVSINERDYDAMGFDFGFRNISQIDYNGRGKGSYKAAINADTGQSTTGVMPADISPSATFGLTATIDQYRLSAIMKALKENHKGRVVNAPRVIAYNNHVAMLKVATERHYATDIETQSFSSSTDRTSSSSTSFVPTNYQTVDVGWRLEVLPSVGADMKTISMRIVPNVTVEDGKEDREIFVSNANSENSDNGKVNLAIPLFKTSTLDVKVNVEDGKTVVVGGLYTASDDNAERGTPFLKDLPKIGALFRTRSDVKSRNALLIFVTAKIINADNGTYTDMPLAYPPLDPRPGDGLPISSEKLNSWLGDPALKPGDRE